MEQRLFIDGSLLKNKKLNKYGSTLFLIVIIIAAITLLGTSLLTITTSQYKIRKSNSEIKKAFYMSESGLNSAYLNVYDLICEACDDSLDKADKYLFFYQEDLSGAENLFKNNYKQYIINRVASKVYSSNNPATKVVNESLLIFNESLVIRISSKYVTDFGIEKSTSADIIVTIPDYLIIKSNEIDISSLLYLDNFDARK